MLADTGPIVALLSQRERDHEWVKRQLAEIEPPLLTCEVVLAEASHLLRRSKAGADALLGLIDAGYLKIAFELDREASRVREILNRYSNVPASLADACLVRMAETHTGSELLTLDSDFTIYRIHKRKVIPVILPERP